MNKIALITGAAKRLGAEITKTLHTEGFDVVIHYRRSKKEAEHLATSLNATRPNSAKTIQADLNQPDAPKKIIDFIHTHFQRLDVLVNNASEYFPTPLAKASEKEWDRLVNSNIKAPYFLIQSAQPLLKKTKGCVINLSDMNTFRYKPDYSIYCLAKSGINVITEMLSKELAPEIRVNAVAPSTTIPPEHLKHKINKPLVKIEDVTSAVVTLVKNKDNGRMIKLDQ